MTSFRRMAVLLPFEPEPDSGILNTFRERLGYWSTTKDVKVFVLTRTETNRTDFDERFTLIYSRNYLSAFREFAKRLVDFGPDVLYARYSLPFPDFLQISRTIPTVFEIHSAELCEYQTHSRKLLMPCGLFRWPVLGRAAGHVFANRSAAEHWSNRVFKVPSIVIGNGIATDPVESRRTKARRADTPLRIAMTVGSDNQWQGLDKFAELAKLFPQHDFVIIGAAGSEVSQPSNIRSLGRLSRVELLNVLSDCDVGIGTLALHRSGRDEVSSLKTREYLAAGLAVLMANEDTDKGVNDLPQVLTIPNRESNITESLDAIEEFFRDVAEGRTEVGDVGFLSSETKEEQRLKFIGDLL